jgi:hypothetical protein
MMHTTKTPGTSLGGPSHRDRLRKLLRRTLPSLLNGVIAASLVLAQRQALAETATQEYQVKAVFLSKFASFVTWPNQAFPDANAPITIGIWGVDPFGQHLAEAIRGEVINGRPLKILKLQKDEEAAGCQILFIRERDMNRISQMLWPLKAKPVLTVGEVGQFTHHGGIVNFTLKEGRVQLEINPDEASRAGLKINSKLLSIATISK